MHRIKVFTDRYPFLGPAIWFLTIQYFIIQFIAASAWKHPHYSWRYNTISDLGNPACGIYSHRLICSPLHQMMNLSFISLGILMAAGSLLIYQEFRERTSTLVGFSLMALAGFGTVMVGFFPENTMSNLHYIGASMPFLLGNISLVILSLSLYRVNKLFKIYTFLSGTIALLAVMLYFTHNYLGLGIGGLERVVAYPQTIWLIIFGIYMSSSHYIKRRRA